MAKNGKKKRRSHGKHQMKDGVFSSMFQAMPSYRLDFYRQYRTSEDSDHVTEEDTRYIPLNREVTEGGMDDVCLRVNQTALFLVEARTTDQQDMDFRLLEYMTDVQRRWIHESEKMSASNPADPELLKYRMMIIYTGLKDVTLGDFTKSLEGKGRLNVRDAITLITREEAKGILKEYFDFLDVWDVQCVLYPESIEKALLETIRICRERGILTDWFEKVGEKKVRSIMDRQAALDDGFRKGMEIKARDLAKDLMSEKDRKRILHSYKAGKSIEDIADVLDLNPDEVAAVLKSEKLLQTY